MPTVDLVVRTPISSSLRARQVRSMFDVPMATEDEKRWSGSVPIEARPWNVGLIVGPSGAGKTSIMRQMFGETPPLEWSAPSLIDDFEASRSVASITDALSAVGFNTIPAWTRPFAVLSNGERFRADLARRLLELPDPVVVDEFTSVVDRQVAQIGAHAVQKLIRKAGRKFVAVTCHYDVIDWLQPDWTLEPSTMAFTWRSVQPRPQLDIEIARVPYSTWARFAPYHYLSADLHRSARCYAAHVNGEPVAFNALLFRPHPKVRDIIGSSRTVCLPDWQGLGLAMAMGDVLGSALKALGYRFHRYPAHPAFIRAHDRSKMWAMVQAPGRLNAGQGERGEGQMGGRPCAVFRYVGPAMADVAHARALIGGRWGE